MSFTRYVVIASTAILLIAVLVFVRVSDEMQPRPKNPGATHSWQVTSVIDGSTLEAVNSEQGRRIIRVFGICTPRPDQPFGIAARERLAELVEGQTISGHDVGLDWHENLVCDIEVRDVNPACLLLSEGLALRTDYAERRHDLGYAEAEAREANRGLWSSGKPNRQDYMHPGDDHGLSRRPTRTRKAEPGVGADSR